MSLPSFVQNLGSPRARAWAATVALVSLVILSGCAGKSNSANSIKGPSVSTQGPDLIDDPSCPGCVNVDAGKFSPKRHYHHYWGDREYVKVFETNLTFKPLVLQPNGQPVIPPEGGVQDVTHNLEQGCLSVGYRQFDLEDDGDDVNQQQLEAIHRDTQRADTIFEGADFLNVTLVGVSSSQTVTGVGLKWKPGNTNQFQPSQGEGGAGACGRILEVDKSTQVAVGSGQADPAHQVFASRWEFLAFCMHRNSELNQNLPGACQGTFHLRILAHNGGEKSLDPAHPDLFAGKEMYDLGCTQEIEVSKQIIAGDLLRPRGQLTDIKWPDGRIVPLLTEKVRVTMEHEYTGSVAGTTAELWFHGSNTTKYHKASSSGSSGTTTTYSIPNDNDTISDPPYEYSTLWRFEIHPIGPNGLPATEYSGKFKICAEADRIPGAILT